MNILRKIKAAPYSNYYAVIGKSDDETSLPLLVVEDSTQITSVVLRKDFFTGNDVITAVIVPDISRLSVEFCSIIFDRNFDTIDVIKLSIVANERGTIDSFTA